MEAEQADCRIVLECTVVSSLLEIPQSASLVTCASSQRIELRVELQTVHPVVVALQLQKTPACLKVPKSRCAVLRCSGKEVPELAETYWCYWPNVVCRTDLVCPLSWCRSLPLTVSNRLH